jgi:hypothetical protein
MRARCSRTFTVVTVVGIAAAAASCSGQGAKSSSAALTPNASRSAAPNATGGTASKAAIDLAVAKRPADDRQIISTAQLEVQARDIDQTVQRASALVLGAQGYLFSESASLATGRHAHVVFKVPPEQFGAVVNGIARLGRVVHRQIGTQDITGQVVDLDARLAAAQTSAERLRQLLADSGGVADLLSVEGQLTTREGQVDSLSGELAALRAQVDMATVTLDVSPLPKHPTITSHHEKPGFTRGLRAGASAFANTARVVEAGFGVALPFAPLALLALAGWWLARRRAAAARGAS